MAPKKRIGILGAGQSGLTAIKCCLDEDLEPVCFERRDDIGGLWYYTDEVKEGKSSVMKTTVINTSKEMMCWSDYPAPKEFPNLMHHSMVLKYFRGYAEHFGLLKYIKFFHETIQVRKSKDFSETGRWDIEVKDLKTGETRVETFDAVFIGTGHHADRKTARFDGQDKFKGSIVHSNEYRTYEGYEGKKVVVLGIGNSGVDVTVELSRIADHVYLATRRGSWVIFRVGDNGLPLDMGPLTRRAALFFFEKLPSLTNTMLEREANKKFDHTLYGLRPKHRLNEAHPTVSDELPTRILSGMVTVKPNIARFTENTVVFEDGTEEEVDAVVMCTGYIFGFPYLEPGVIPVKDNKVDLYKYVFPPDLEHPTIAVLGCVQPWGPILPIGELSARWACRVFNGKVKLPPKDVMLADIKEKWDANYARYATSTRHTIQVDWVHHMDDLAVEIGVKPNLWRMLRTDPVLAWKCMVEPCTPYQYRLEGPGKWSGARQAIMTQMDRVYATLMTRKAEDPPRSWFSVVIVVVLLAILVKWFISGHLF